MKKKRLTIDIPEDFHEEFLTVAFFTKVTMKDMMIEKIKEIVKEYKNKESKEQNPKPTTAE